MSVIDAPLLQPHADSDTKRHSQYHVPTWVTRLAPKQGWDTFLLLLAPWASLPSPFRTPDELVLRG